jgi:hypothetical protein
MMIFSTTSKEYAFEGVSECVAFLLIYIQTQAWHIPIAYQMDNKNLLQVFALHL